MLESREAAGKAVVNVCKGIMSRGGYKANWDLINDYVEKKHKIPIHILNDYLCLKKSPIDAPIELLYCIMEAVDVVISHGGAPLVARYFSQDEIAKYKKYKYVTTKIKFPLAFDATQITDSQWIGRITVQDLMKLQPIIKYNENTQRSLKRETLGEVEIYSIFLNRHALDEITESYQNNTYIPNTITLNIPEDVDFRYENGQLIFKSLESLDILDGYHRYVAMTNLWNVDNEFDYVMEVRWVCFGEDKARQFIWQEDQKTKMTKVESAAFNQNDPGNQLINMLNQVTALKGIVDRNGVIDSGVAARFINQLWFNKPKHNYTRKEIVEVKKEIERGLIDILDNKPDAFDRHWDSREIGALFISIRNSQEYLMFDYIAYINKEEVPIHSNVTKREVARLMEYYTRLTQKGGE